MTTKTALTMLTRCPWVGDEPEMLRYHDEEWGVPQHDDRRLFEALMLEGAQAGLSWRTILLRREGFRRAFHGWDLDRIASMGESDVQRLLQDPGIIRHRGKIESTISNAGVARGILMEWGSLDGYLWQFVGAVRLAGPTRAAPDAPPLSEVEDEVDRVTQVAEGMSKQMRKDGFRFVGPTTLTAFMEAAGMVNHHAPDCFRYAEV